MQKCTVTFGPISACATFSKWRVLGTDGKLRFFFRDTESLCERRFTASLSTRRAPFKAYNKIFICNFKIFIIIAASSCSMSLYVATDILFPVSVLNYLYICPFAYSLHPFSPLRFLCPRVYFGVPHISSIFVS